MQLLNKIYSIKLYQLIKIISFIVADILIWILQNLLWKIRKPWIDKYYFVYSFIQYLSYNKFYKV